MDVIHSDVHGAKDPSTVAADVLQHLEDEGPLAVVEHDRSCSRRPKLLARRAGDGHG
jgi:hypothetical protein